MSLLSSITQSLGAYVSPIKTSLSVRPLTPPVSESASSENDEEQLERTYRHSADPFEDNFDGETLIAPQNLPQKPPGEPRGTRLSKSARKRKNEDRSYALDAQFDNDSDDDTLLTSTPKPKKLKTLGDRELMPPPSVPKSQTRSRSRSATRSKGLKQKRKDSGVYVDEDDQGEYVQSPGLRPADRREVFEFDALAAKREAEAIAANPEIEFWSKSERDLFTHLALRGFEPMLPRNWMIDFRTLPEQAFSNDDTSEPLIVPHILHEFRAVEALRNLFTLGGFVRDCALSHEHLRPENLIRKAVCHYISWALADVEMKPEDRPYLPPVYAVAILKANTTSCDAIASLSIKLRTTSSQWQSAVRSHLAVKEPILYGFLITGSLINIVTMDANPINQPAATVEQLQGYDPESLQEVKDQSGMRFIATFDLSDSGMDVWNALAIAICVRSIQNELLALKEEAESIGKGEAHQGSLWTKGGTHEMCTASRDVDA